MVPIRFARRARRQGDAELFYVLEGPWEGLELELLEEALCGVFGFEVREVLERSRGRATSQVRALLVALAHDLLSISTTELRWRYRIDRRTVGRDLYDGREWVRGDPEVRALIRRALPRWADRVGPVEVGPSARRVPRPPPPPAREWRYVVEPDSVYGRPTRERRARLVEAFGCRRVQEREATGLLGSEDPTSTSPPAARHPVHGALGGVTPRVAPAAETWVMPPEDG